MGCVVDRIVGAVSCSIREQARARVRVRVFVFVCGLCWSISASRLVALAGCLRLVYLSSGLLGTF